MRKDLFTILILTSVFMAAFVISPGVASPTPKVYIDPVTSTADVGGTFSINIKIADVSDLFTWGTRLRWNSTLLNATSATEGPFLKGRPQGTAFIKKINNTGGYIDLSVTILGDYSGIDGSGVLATIGFKAKAVGETVLEFFNLRLINHFLFYITPFDQVNGYFINSPNAHDIAIIGLNTNTSIVQAGESVSISVTVLNQGAFTETFNVTTYYGNTQIANQTGVSLDSGQNTTRAFLWNTLGLAQGNYTITAVASPVPKEIDIADNTVKVYVTIPWHDVAVTVVTASTMSVTAGEIVHINVTVENHGQFTENFNVTIFYDSTQITKQTVTLIAGQVSVLKFNWDTTNVAQGEYLVKASAEGVINDINLLDNSKTLPFTNSITVNVPQQGFPYALLLGVVAAVVIVAALGLFFFLRRRGSKA